MTDLPHECCGRCANWQGDHRETWNRAQPGKCLRDPVPVKKTAGEWCGSFEREER